jgi:predicted amidohydrolase
MKLVRNVLLLILLLLSIGYIWSVSGRVAEGSVLPGVTMQPVELLSFGNKDSGDANIIGMQPYLTTSCYANAASFYAVLNTCLAAAKKNNLLNTKTIVVFPEYIGSWLVAANEKNKVYDSTSTISEALTLQVLSNLFRYIPAYLSCTSADKTREALFRMKQATILRIYQDVFSRLAKTYGITIVAGSVVLASPAISPSGRIITGDGKLYNTSVVFSGDGKVLSPLVKKIFPISDEQGFTCAADTAQSPVFNTPAGRLAVLVCADSWFPAAYRQLINRADVIAIPSLGSADSIWTSPWNGYNGFAAPADVDTLADYHHITEGDAWAKYAMAKRAPAVGIRNGMNVFFTGRLWDMHPEGRVLTLHNNLLHVSAPAIQKSRITNLWFSKNK